MAHLFNENYLKCNEFTLSMIVNNGVVGDSRVLKTADSLNKRGYRVHLFGLNRKPQQEEVEGFPFRITLVSNPAKTMKKEGVYYISEEKQDLELYYERLALAYLEAFDQNEYDFLHTHDMWGLSVGAKLREWGVTGEKGWVHDIHEYMKGSTHILEEKQSFHLSMENKLILEPDVLTCVTPGMARLLSEEYNIELPKVILNTPRRADFDPFYPKPVRRVLNLEGDIPLMVYSGNVRPVRGVHLAVEALSHLSDFHLALITKSKGAYLEELLQRAEQLGVSSRLHILPYVPGSDVTSFLCGATVGIKPVIQYGNSDISLPTKLFEYIHAGVPVVHTATNSVAEFMSEYKCGFTHPSEDVDGFVDAINKVLQEFPDGLPNAAEGSELVNKFSWEEQEKVLFSVYDSLLSKQKHDLEMKPVESIQPIIHLPRHSANQPATLARALRKLYCTAYSAAYGNKFGYVEDIKLQKQKNVLSAINNYLLAQGLDKFKTFHFHAFPLLYKENYNFPAGLDLVLIKAMGKRVFFHYRGAEVRLPSVYKKTSPYNYVDDFLDDFNNYRKRVEGLPYRYDEQDQREFRDFVRGVCDAVFVTDAELQCYVPGAMIVPRAIDVKKIKNFRIDNKQTVPLIVHAPSRGLVKGTDNVIAAVETLKQEGYEFNFTIVENMSHEEAMALYGKANIIIDQLRIGWYGVLAVEGMAMGKAVVSFVSNHLRHYLPCPPPLVYANPDNITGVLRYLLENPEEVARYGERGRKFVEEYHDASRIAETLLKIYRRPVRPVDPVAIANFMEYQMQKKKALEKAKKSHKKSSKTKKSQKSIIKKVKPKIKKLVKVTRKKGAFAAVKKTVGFVRKKIYF